MTPPGGSDTIVCGRYSCAEKKTREPHYDIWSIPAGKFRWYITLLLTSGSAVCAYLIYGSVGSPEHATGQDLTRAIITDVILSYTGAAVGSFVVIKGGEPLMVLAHFLREKLNKRSERLQQEAQTRGLNQGLAEGLAEGLAQGLAQGQAEGLAEGLAEGEATGRAAANAEWAAWNRRRTDAEAAGMAFNEPPPDDNGAC